MSTAKALASELGVSIATVSRALNGKPGISPRLREHILNEAAQRNTYISQAARMLATSKSQNICFALYHLPGPVNQDPFYFQVLMGLEAEIRKAGLNLTIELLDDDAIKDPESWRIVREKRADGIILNGPFVPTSFIVKLNALGVPVVLIDNFLDVVSVDAVVAGDKSGAEEVARHIIELGHRKVVIFSGPQDWYSNKERVAGFISSLKTSGVKNPSVYYEADTTFESGKALYKLAKKGKATAILAVNDAMAMGAMDAALADGLIIPRDLSITGFDDVDSAANWTVPLTTVQIPKNFIGRSAGRILWSRIDDPQAPRQRVDIGAKLIVRQSTGKAPQKRVSS